MPLLLTFPTGSVKEYWEKTKIPLRFTPFQSNGRETACQCRPQRRLRSPRARLDRPRPVGMPRSPPIQRRSQSRTTRERQSTETPGRRRARRPGTTGEAAAAAGARRGRRRKPRCGLPRVGERAGEPIPRERVEAEQPGPWEAAGPCDAGGRWLVAHAGAGREGRRATTDCSEQRGARVHPGMSLCRATAKPPPGHHRAAADPRPSRRRATADPRPLLRRGHRREEAQRGRMATGHRGRMRHGAWRRGAAAATAAEAGRREGDLPAREARVLHGNRRADPDHRGVGPGRTARWPRPPPRRPWSGAGREERSPGREQSRGGRRHPQPRCPRRGRPAARGSVRRGRCASPQPLCYGRCASPPMERARSSAARVGRSATGVGPPRRARSTASRRRARTALPWPPVDGESRRHAGRPDVYSAGPDKLTRIGQRHRPGCAAAHRPRSAARSCHSALPAAARVALPSPAREGEEGRR